MTASAVDYRSAVARAGCRVCEVDEGDASGRRGEVDCGDGWGAARLLLELAKVDAAEPWMRTFAERLRASVGATSADDYARAVFNLVQGSVRFEREIGEVFQSPRVTLERGVGDCDCHSRLVYTLLVAGGVPSRLAFLGRSGGGPRHVVAQARTETGWTWLETTVPGARYGEHPIAGAIRVGAVRPDVSPGYAEVTTMGAIGIEGGNVYRFRLASSSTRAWLPDRPELVIERALFEAGFADVRVWLEPRELPSTWPVPKRDPVAGAEWTAWAEALFAESVCRELDTLGPMHVVDAWIATSDLVAAPNLGAVSATPPAPPIVHTKALSEKFFTGLKKVASDLGTRPEYLLAVMLSESGLNPAAAYRVGNNKASGLIQLVFLDGVGFTGGHDAFVQLSAEQQLPYIARHYRPYAARGLGSAERVYQVNFLPASLERGSTSATPIARADGDGYGGREGEFYGINKGLDVDKDGVITVGDLKAKLQQAQMQNAPKWQEAIARLKAAPDPSPAPIGAVVGLVVGLGLAWWAGS